MKEQEELERHEREEAEKEEVKRKEQQEREQKEQLLKQQQIEINAQNVSFNDSNCSNQAAISSNSSQSIETTTDLSQHSSVAVVSQHNLEQATTEWQPAVREVSKSMETTKEVSPPDENSDGASTERSESAVKEVPMSGDRHRFSRSKSPKARWQGEFGDSTETGEAAKEADLSLAESDDRQKTEESSKDSATESTNVTTDELPKVQRKRKWLTNDQTAANILSHKKQLTISSDTLKSYLPTTPTFKDKEDNMGVITENNNEESTDRRVIETDMPGYNNEHGDKQETRIVKIGEVLAGDSCQNGNKQANGHVDEPLRTITNNLKMESSGHGGKRQASNILHISNLTRPFTVPQLKELLGKFGSLMENEKSAEMGLKEKDLFWINSVKSHCFVAFVDEKSGREAREGLHQITWPQSNPKRLNVEFASMDDMEFVVKHNDMPSMKNHQNHEFPK